MAIAAALICITAVLAEKLGPGTFDLSWNTVDGGGGKSTGGAFDVTGTIGQPDASAVPMTGGAFSLTGGFWPGASPVIIPTCPADIAPQPNGDGLVNVSDLLAVINNWGPCPAPPALCSADITHDGNVSVNDLLAVINSWGVCP